MLISVEKDKSEIIYKHNGEKTSLPELLTLTKSIVDAEHKISTNLEFHLEIVPMESVSAEDLTPLFLCLKQAGVERYALNSSDKRRAMIRAMTHKQAERGPAWDGQSDPPLSIAEATRIARDHLTKDNPAFEHYFLSEMKLSREYPDGWFYTVNLGADTQRPGKRLSNAYFVVDVLLDGTVRDHRFYNEWEVSQEQPIKGVPDVIRCAGDLPIDEAKLLDVERRMNVIVMPEVDFRQANLYDVVDFIDKGIVEYGNEIEKKDATRVRIKVGQFLTQKEYRAILPPHATWWNAVSDGKCLVTFTGRNMSVLEVMKSLIKIIDLEYTIHGNLVTINDPRKSAKQRVVDNCPKGE